MSKIGIRNNKDGSWFTLGSVPGPRGKPGAIFTPTVSEEGIISWSNNGGLVNSDPIYIMVPAGPVAMQDSAVSFTGIFSEGINVSGTTESTSVTTGAVTIAGGLGASGTIYANNVCGAVFNDYAEYRRCSQHILPGSVVVEVGDDSVICSSDRLQLGAMIISDTYGFCIGESEQGVPVAIAGRVLAYPFEERETFKNSIGRAVCSGPNGTVSIMSDQEVKDNPLAIIGTVSSVPDYNTWGSNNIDVSGRVWIKVK